MPEARKLTRFEVDEISLAKNPANRRGFVLLKELLEKEPEVGEEILKALHHHLSSINEILGGDEKTLRILASLANIVEEDHENQNESWVNTNESKIVSLTNIASNLSLLRNYLDNLQKEMYYMGDFQKENWRVGGDRDLRLIDDDSWDADAAVASVRRWATGENGEINFTKYKRAFIIYDADAPDNLTSYKFPFARVVDGELRASRSGLITAKRAAAGARTGRRHPLADRIIAFVNSYLGENEEEKEMTGMDDMIHQSDTTAEKAEITKGEIMQEYEALKKELESLRQRAEAAEALAKEEREKRVAKEWEDRAEAYKVFGVDKSVLAKMMRTLDEAQIDWKPVFDSIAKKLETSELYREVGISSAPTGSTFEDILAQELQKDTNRERSVLEVIRELARVNPELYEQYRRKFAS